VANSDARSRRIRRLIQERLGGVRLVKVRLMSMHEIRRYQVYRLERPRRPLIARLRRALRVHWFR
jgi:hypothetical protein